MLALSLAKDNVDWVRRCSCCLVSAIFCTRSWHQSEKEKQAELCSRLHVLSMQTSAGKQAAGVVSQPAGVTRIPFQCKLPLGLAAGFGSTVKSAMRRWQTRHQSESHAFYVYLPLCLVFFFIFLFSFSRFLILYFHLHLEKRRLVGFFQSPFSLPRHSRLEAS